MIANTRAMSMSFWLLVLLFTFGCAQYMGYHYESRLPEDEPGPGELRPRKFRVEVYGSYDGLWDFLELLAWPGAPAGLILLPCYAYPLAPGEPGPFEDPHVFCAWPPIDLLARLCGSSGYNGREEGKVGLERYDRFPPPYWRRLLQWLGWVFPGYTMDHPHCWERWVPADGGQIGSDLD